MTFDLDGLKRRMTATLEMLTKEFSGLRAGRASVSLLEPIRVDAYGSLVPLSQVASVNAPEARLLTVQVWDRSLVKAVEKAIRESGLGLNPAGEGQLLRVPMPELTEQRRQELSKMAAKYAEEARVSIRNIRREAMDSLKKMEKDKLLSEDEHRRHGQEVQKMTDEFIQQTDTHLQRKQKDILVV
jgi:ribosome recycling factor